jgi:ABC-type glutathione transport system ATPase component
MEKLRISKDDLKNVVEPLAKAKGWKRQDQAWAMQATVSIANLKRFWSSTPISEDHVAKICLAVGLEDYRAIAIVGEADSVSSSASLPEPKTNWFAFDEGCVGRDRLVDDLRDRLKTVRILGLVGLTGIGKTALAERLAQDTQEQWGKILRVNFDDVEKCKDFYTVAIALLEGLGAVISPEDRKDPEQLRNWLIGFESTFGDVRLDGKYFAGQY